MTRHYGRSQVGNDEWIDLERWLRQYDDDGMYTENIYDWTDTMSYIEGL